MLGGPVLLVVLWLVAAGLAIWILGPTVAFLLGLRRIETDVYAEPPIAKPYPEDTDGLRRYKQFLDLGFRPIGWTFEHARFLTPLHWRWRSVEGSRWLAAPDNRTFACIYRVAPDEPARFGALTLLEGEGSWGTYYPGVGLETEPIGNQGRAEIRGVEPAELLTKHAEHVEAFQRQRGLETRAGSLADVARASLTYTRAHLAARSSAGLAVLPLSLFLLPAFGGLAAVARGTPRSQLVGAVMVIGAALFYAALRYGLLGLMRGYSARRTHTREFDLEQTALSPDGTIVPGSYERWVRLIAGLGVVDMIARLVVMASKGRAILVHGPGTTFFAGLIALICALNLYNLARRVVGRAPWRKAGSRSRQNVWFSWGVVNFVFTSSNGGLAHSRFLWIVGAVGLAVLANWLEKRGRNSAARHRARNIT